MLAPGGGSRARAIAISVAAPAAALGLALLIQPQRELGAALAVPARGRRRVRRRRRVGGRRQLRARVPGAQLLLHRAAPHVPRSQPRRRRGAGGVPGGGLVGRMGCGACGGANATGPHAASGRPGSCTTSRPRPSPGNRWIACWTTWPRRWWTRCGWPPARIEATAGGRSFGAMRATAGRGPGAPVRISIASGATTFGTLAAARAARRRGPFTEDERLLEAAARQIAVLLERAELDAEVAAARLEAETQPDPGGAVLLGHARSADAAGLDQGGRDEPAPGGRGTRHGPATGAAAHGPRGNRPAEPAGRQHRGPGACAGGRADSGEGADRARRGRGGGPPSDGACGRPASPSDTNLRDVPDVPVDPVQIDQVLSNLIENAVRFSPPGGEIVVSVAPWHANVQVRVADHGPGISPQDRERVFEPFATRRLDARCPRGERSGPRDRAGDRARARRSHLDRGGSRRRDRGRVRAPGRETPGRCRRRPVEGTA